jgi:hypothetical protein
MTTIRNVDPRKVALEIDATGQVVEPGATVEVADETLAASLLEQTAVWAAGDTTAAPAATTAEENA